MGTEPQNRGSPNSYPDEMAAYLEQQSTTATSPVALEFMGPIKKELEKTEELFFVVLH